MCFPLLKNRRITFFLFNQQQIELLWVFRRLQNSATTRSLLIIKRTQCKNRPTRTPNLLLNTSNRVSILIVLNTEIDRFEIIVHPIDFCVTANKEKAKAPDIADFRGFLVQVLNGLDELRFGLTCSRKPFRTFDLNVFLGYNKAEGGDFDNEAG